MSGSHMEDERLAAIAEETEAMETQRLSALAGIGEKALPELRANPAFAELVALADEAAARIGALKQEEAALRAEIERREREEKERLAKRTCFVCKAVNPEGAKFCEECGAKLGAFPKEYCRACNAMNQPGQKFCGECGNRLEI